MLTMAPEGPIARSAVQPFDQLPAGADVGGHRRHAGRVALQDDQRQRFADRRQDGQADLRHQVFDLLEAEETDMVFQAQAAHQGVALGGVGRSSSSGPAIQPSARASG